MKKRVFGLLAMVFVPAMLAATILTQMSTGDMVALADVIVVGKCTGRESKWEDRNLFTYTAVAVAEVFKGKPQPSVTVVLPGGVDLKGPVPIGQDYEGASVILPGEKVMLFLQRIEGIPNGYSIVGYSQGKFTVREEKGVKTAFRDLSGVYFPRQKSWQPAGAVSLPLSQFQDEIKRLLKAGKVSAQGPSGKP